MKMHTARLKEELSSMLFSGDNAPKSEAASSSTASTDDKTFSIASDSVSQIASKVFEISKNETVASAEASSPQNASPAAKPSFDEEIKIPAWLEPLARNTVAPASTQELIERQKAKIAAETKDSVLPLIVEPLPAEETVPAPRPEVRVPSFGSTLPMDEKQNSAEKTPSRSGTGIWIGAVAAGICLAAAGGFWYWKQQQSAPAVTSVAVPAAAAPSAPASGPAVNAASAAPIPVEQTNSPSALNQPLAAATAPAAEVRATSESVKAAHQIAPTSSKLVQPAPVTMQPKSASRTNGEPQPEPAKPSLGQVHLATPKVNRKSGSQDIAINAPDPGMGVGGSVPGADSMNGNLGIEAGKQPTAPVAPIPVGGVVKQAIPRSTVPPAYPVLARNQHVSGDVKIDALIDATGRVTSMNVISGPTLLRQAAMDALRQWKYQPATLDGNAVPMHLTVTIQFHLQ